jgi:hypothetical protein
MGTETAFEGPKTAVAAAEAVLPPVRAPTDLAWTIVQMRAGERITVNEALIAAYQAASSPHSIRALKSDIEAFDAWCRRVNRVALPATAETVADYLDARAGKGSRPASLSRYKASIAKIHQLLDLKDPTPAPLVKLRLQAVRREKGAAQRQARPLRFKGPVCDVERDKARGLISRILNEMLDMGWAFRHLSVEGREDLKSDLDRLSVVEWPAPTATDATESASQLSE